MEIVAEPRPRDNVAVVDPALTELTAALRRAVRAHLGRSTGFAGFESMTLALSNEATRAVLQPGTIRVHSLVGPIDVERWTYRETGVRNGPTYAPFERAAGLLERATPALSQAIARGYADRSSRALHEDLVGAARIPPSRSTSSASQSNSGSAR